MPKLFQVIVSVVALNPPYTPSELKPQLRAETEEEAKEVLVSWLKDVSCRLAVNEDGSPVNLQIIELTEEGRKRPSGEEAKDAGEDPSELRAEMDTLLGRFEEAEKAGARLMEANGELVDKLAKAEGRIAELTKELEDTKALLKMTEEDNAKLAAPHAEVKETPSDAPTEPKQE